jgi:low temperature requirement protein LtrA
MNVEHLSERFGLLIIIVLGESVLITVTAISDTWTLPAGITAVLALATVSMLAWTFFLYGADTMQEGLEGLRATGNIRAIRDTVAFLPFFLVIGVTIISGALSVAIHHPHEALPPASALSLGGGIALFYFTIALISIRFGNARQKIFRWALPAVILPLALGIAALVLPAAITVGGTTAILAIVIGTAELTTR